MNIHYLKKDTSGNMKIHYFRKDNSDSHWWDIKLEAWKEDENVLYNDTNKKASSFTCIEEINLHSGRGGYKVTHFEINFGMNSIRSAHARTKEELIKENSDGLWSLEECSKNEYLESRGILMGEYLKETSMDFSQNAKK